MDLKKFATAVLLALTIVSPRAVTAAAQNPQFQVIPVDDAWRAALPRDADAATKAYLDRLPPATVARSNAYFEGGYWLLLWNYLVWIVIAAILLTGQRSARMRDWAQRVGRVGLFRDAIYGAFFATAAFVIGLPLTIYEEFVREHQYGMATQTFGPWFGEQLIGLGVSVVITAIGVGMLYAAIRRAGENWWLWGTGVAVALAILVLLAGPVWIDPLFNTYKPVQDPQIKAAALAMAKADGVPVDNVYQFDASRQTTRVSANVSGIFGSAAVRLNDNLLRASLPEIRAVMGHELGHYVLNHVYKAILEFGALFMAGFLFVQWAMKRLQARFSERFGLRGVADVAGLPVFAAVFATFFFLATPIKNTIIRVQEIEADRFGFNLAREPLGAAEAYLKVTEYRKPNPSPMEEFVFFDHPSTRFRIHDAMRWREAMGSP